MLNFKVKPYEHQLSYLEKHAFDVYHGLFWEQGTAKTKALIDNAAILWHADKIDGVLVVAPPGVCVNWFNEEVPTHLEDETQAVSSHHKFQPKKTGTKWYQQALLDFNKTKGLAWFYIAYDGFVSQRAKKAIWNFLQARKTLFICDESMFDGGIKTPGAKRTKSVCAAGQHAAYRRIADGTPVAEGPFDAYSPIRFLDNDYWKPYGLSPFACYKANFGVFRTASQVLREEGYDPGYDKLIGYQNLPELTQHLERVGSRVLKKDVLDLPPKSYKRATFQMSKEQWDIYNTLKEEYMVEWEGGLTTAELAIVRYTRLQQIVSGYMPFDDENEMVDIPGGNPRLELMEEYRDLTHVPTIVWARWNRDVDKLMDLLGPKAVRYDGKVTNEECGLNVKRFQEGEADWIVLTQSKGSSGITLHRAEEVIYYTQSERLRQRLQSEDRAHRAGLTHPVGYTDFIAEGTVDVKKIRSLVNKLEISAMITGDNFGEWI